MTDRLPEDRKGGVIGITIPPITATEFNVLGDDTVFHAGTSLLGNLVEVEYERAGAKALLVGVVVDFEVVNHFTDYIPMARSVKAAGAENERVRGLAHEQSTLILRCQVVSAFDLTKRIRIPYDLPIPPFSAVRVFSQKRLEELTEGRGPFFQIGTHYGTTLPHLLHLEGFARMSEAYHFVVAGVTGSGKSTLAKTLLLGYGRNREMGFFLLDTAGEFARAFNDQDQGLFSLPMRTLWHRMGRKVPRVYGVDQLILGTWELFTELASKERLLEPLNVKHPENQRRATEALTEILRDRKKGLSALHKIGALELKDALLSPAFLKAAYSSEERRGDVREAIDDPARWGVFYKKFLSVAQRFYPRDATTPTTWGLVQTLLQKGETIVVDLSSLAWDDPVKYLVIRELLRALYVQAMGDYKKTGTANFNTLVVVEEAHRLVPPSSWVGDREELKATRELLLRALTETRKAGLGWMFISTRISNLDRAVFEEARVRAIGTGLSTGEDADRIRDVFGPEALNRYRSLPDPTDPLSGTRQHIFMVTGPICVLRRGGAEFVEVFDNPELLLAVNGLGAEGTGEEEAWREPHSEPPDVAERRNDGLPF